MRDQIILFPNGNLAIAIPLYRKYHTSNAYEITLQTFDEKPISYLIDWGGEKLFPMNAEYAERKLEWLGDL